MPGFSHMALIINPAGCQGNENRFGNMEECVNTCGGETPLDSTGNKTILKNN